MEDELTRVETESRRLGGIVEPQIGPGKAEREAELWEYHTAGGRGRVCEPCDNPIIIAIHLITSKWRQNLLRPLRTI